MDGTEKANLLKNYFYKVAKKRIGPADEIQPLQVHYENTDSRTPTNITMKRKEIA